MANDYNMQTAPDRPIEWSDYPHFYSMLSLVDFTQLMERGGTLRSAYAIS